MKKIIKYINSENNNKEMFKNSYLSKRVFTSHIDILNYFVKDVMCLECK